MIGQEGPASTTNAHDHERKRLLCWWLRSAIDTAEAEAMQSSGYRPSRCGNCGRRGCIWCDTDRAEQVRSGRRTSADPRFVSAVLDKIDRFPRELLIRAQPSIAALPPAERLVLLLTEGAGLTFADAARHLKIGRATVATVHARALDNLAARVWASETQEVHP